MPPTHPILDTGFSILDPRTHSLTIRLANLRLHRIEHPASSIQHPASGGCGKRVRKRPAYTGGAWHPAMMLSSTSRRRAWHPLGKGVERRVENPKSEFRNPNSDLDWRIFSDATCAGLSVLIPLPLVDIVFETIFRRRIPATIAKVRRRETAPDVRRKLGRGLDGPLSLSGCLSIGLAAVKYVLRRIWRKIIYIFAVKDATAALTEYWHRAFLIDHMVRAGHLDPGADTDLALQVSTEVLRDIDPSPLMEMARQTVANVHHVFRLLVRARRLGAAEVTRSLGEVLSSHWKVAEDSMEATAQLYNERYIAAVFARAEGTGRSGTMVDG